MAGAGWQPNQGATFRENAVTSREAAPYAVFYRQCRRRGANSDAQAPTRPPVVEWYAAHPPSFNTAQEFTGSASQD